MLRMMLAILPPGQMYPSRLLFTQSVSSCEDDRNVGTYSPDAFGNDRRAGAARLVARGCAGRRVCRNRVPGNDELLARLSAGCGRRLLSASDTGLVVTRSSDVRRSPALLLDQCGIQ